MTWRVIAHVSELGGGQVTHRAMLRRQEIWFTVVWRGSGGEAESGSGCASAGTDMFLC